MSRAVSCDNCGTTLIVDKHGEDVDGETSGWIRVEIAGTSADLCTRSCAHEYLDDAGVVEAHEAHLSLISEIARTIRESREADGEEAS